MVDYQVQQHVYANTAGFTTVWAPLPFKRFRLLSVVLTVESGTSLVGDGPVTVQLYDENTPLPIWKTAYIPPAPLLFEVASPRIMLGPGIVSAAPGNKLRAHLSRTLTTGKISVVAMGGEEE